MASTTSFKQQCPSCEAMVPIRDPGLIGRKIDCPKCKYRFVVEKPKTKGGDEEESSSDTPAPTKKVKNPDTGVKTGKPDAKPAKSDKVAPGKPKTKPGARRRDEDDEEEDERPKKKKSGVSMTVWLGAGLGGLALILLVVGGFMLFGGGGGGSNKDTKTPTPPGGTPPPVAQNPKNPGEKPGDANNPQPSSGPFIADVSNLLPNDAETVVNYQIDKLHDSGLGQTALGPGAFSEKAFNDTFSFPLYAEGGKGVERVLTAVNNTNHWVFTVLHTQKNLAVNRDALIANLQLEAKPAVNGLVAYSVKRDLDGLGTLLIKANRPHPDLQMVILDSRTLVFADPAPMDKFLADKGHPTLKSQPTQAAAPPGNNPGPGGSTPPGPGGSMPPGPGGSMPPGPGGSMPPGPGGSMPPGPGGSMPPGPGGSMPPGPGGSMPPGPGGSGPAAPNTPPAPPPQLVGSYLTVDPGMKAVFDRIEKSDQAILISAVLHSKDPLLDQFGQLLQGRAASWQTSKDTSSDDQTRSILDTVKVFRPQDVSASWIGFSVTAFSSDKLNGLVAVDMGTDQLAKPIVTLLQPFITGANGVLTGSSQATPPPNGATGPPGGTFGPGGTTGPPGGTFGPGGTTGPPGGTFGPPGGTFGPPGGTTGPPGGTFGPPGGTLGGTTGPPGGTFGPPGGATGPGGVPMDPNQGQGPLTLTQDKSLIVLSASLTFGEKAKGKMDQEISQLITRLKAGAEMASSRSRIHELAAALQRYVQKNGHFPRGTVHRDLTGERFVEWTPSQRVSWMADLLPYLGDGEFALLPVDGKSASWREGSNLRVAGVMIPQFISHSDPNTSPLVRYPGVPLDVAVTNYVGVAGRGLDAADFPAGDPRDGIFGYDRETKPADVKDGLDKTIALLQIPVGKTPWLAGGGATIRGVSEGPDALAQFVCADYQGRQGTFAVMGDGKVRFIPADMDPNKFVAMCTIAGGEKLDDIDQIAPVVPDDNPVAAPPPDKGPEVTPPPPAPTPPPDKPADKPDAAKGWSEYTSKDGGYTVSLPPYKFAEQTMPLQTSLGVMTAHAYGAPLPDNGGLFVAAYADFPAAPAADKIDNVLDDAVKGAVANLPGAKLTDQSKISLDGNAGREIALDAGLHGRAKMRVYIVKGRLYEVMAAGTPDKVPDKDIQTFLDSFKLTAK